MSIDVQQPDLEHIVDLEAYFAARRAVPQGRKYRIRIDKQHPGEVATHFADQDPCRRRAG